MLEETLPLMSPGIDDDDDGAPAGIDDDDEGAPAGTDDDDEGVPSGYRR